MSVRSLRLAAFTFVALVLAAGLAAGAFPLAQKKLPAGVTASIDVLPGSWPMSITSAYGSIWSSSPRSTDLYRISPRTNKIVATIDIGREACGRITSGFGKIWVPRCDEPNGVVVIDAAKNRVVKVIRQAFTLDVAFGAGSAWIPMYDGTLARVDPKTFKTTASLKGLAGFLAFDGAYVWSLNPDSGVVSQIDPATNQVTWTTTVPEPPFGSSYLDAYKGKLWFSSDAPALASLDLTTKALVQLDITAQRNLADRPLAIGLGSLWWRTTSKTVARIDPKTGKVIARYPTASFGWQTVAFGSLWAQNVVSSSIWRVKAVK